MMRRIIELFKADFKRRWNKPLLILLYLVSPIIFAAIMWLAFGGGGDGFSPLNMAVVNKDKNGMISDFLVNAFKNEQMEDRLKTYNTDKKTADKMLENGEISAILIIPENFTGDFFDEKNPSLILKKNPAHQIYPEMSETILEILKEAVDYLLTFFYDEFQILKNAFENEGNITEEKLINLYDDMKNKIEIIVKIVEEPSIGLDEVKEKEEKEKVPITVYFFPGLSFFFMFFIASAALTDSVKERSKFILKRLFASNLRKYEYALSKILSCVIFILVIEIVLSIAGYMFFSLTVESVLLFLGLIFIAAVLITSLFVIITSISEKETQVHNISMIFIFLFAILGGSMIPVQNLPDFLKSIAFISPIYHINNATISIILGDMGKFDLYFTNSIIIGLILFIVGFIFNIKALKRVIR